MFHFHDLKVIILFLTLYVVSYETRYKLHDYFWNYKHLKLITIWKINPKDLNILEYSKDNGQIITTYI